MIDQLILEISQLMGQSKSLSVRHNTFWSYKRADNNIFAPVSTLFILESLKHHFSQSSMEQLAIIHQKVIELIPKYANKDGKPSFNFYPTKPSQHFHGGWFMHRFKHFKLPDDLDDSSIIYLTGNYSTEQKISFKSLAIKHICTVPEFTKSRKTLKVYNTWFANKMPDEVDLCVLCNMLFFIFKNELPLLDIDKNTILYLSESISLINKNTFWLSRHYGNVPLIIYHYARLMGSFDIPELKIKQGELIQIALGQLQIEKVFLNKILLETSLIKLGVARPTILNIDIEHFEKDFYAFIGAPLAPIKPFRSLAKYKPGQIYYSSSIQNRAYLVEYLTLNKKHSFAS